MQKAATALFYLCAAISFVVPTVWCIVAVSCCITPYRRSMLLIVSCISSEILSMSAKVPRKNGRFWLLVWPCMLF